MAYGAVCRRPIKAALAAASEHLAGLLPLHLAYSQAHETAIEVSHIVKVEKKCFFSLCSA